MESVENTPPQGNKPLRIGHVATGIGLSIVVSAIIGAAVVAYVQKDPMPLWVIALLQIPMWVGLLVPLIFFGKGNPRWKNQLGIPLRKGKQDELSFSPTRRTRKVLTIRQSIEGLLIGIFSQAVLTPLLYLPILIFVDDLDVSGPARELTDQAHGAGILLLILIVVVGAPVFEELFFRGYALRAFERRWSPTTALITSSILFGLVHFQPLQFPALVLFGFIAGKLAQRDEHIGRAVWAHVGFNAYTVFVLVYL